MDTTGVGNRSEEATDTVAEDVVRLLAGLLQRDPASIGRDAQLFGDLGLDSTSFLEVLMQTENDLGVEFDPYDLEPHDFETVGTLISFVRKQMEA
ncbi:acyl carrier protein [Streptomyces sp. NPDC020731]|uniref:acyl carrier protein n=1 Tax=Streptomyces sp. NPDC020731 TaxID=3365085 RepID=UPI00379E9428